MLALIIVIGILCILFGVITKAAKVVFGVVGAFFLICMILAILREYGGVLLNAAGVILWAAIIIFGVLIVAAVVYGIYTKIKLALNTKKYIQWLDTVGISENRSAPFDSEVQERAVFKGDALRLDSKYTASFRFYQEAESEILQKQMFTISDFTAVVQTKSRICIPTDGIVAMMEYLAKKNSLVLFDPTAPTTADVPEYCCIQRNLSHALTELARKEGMVTQGDFKTVALNSEPILRAAAWLPSSFLELLVSKGEMEKAVKVGDEQLYKMKGSLEGSKATTTEISLDDDF